MFTVGQSPPISRANERQQQIQQPWIQEVAGNHRLGRFTNETPEERERRLEIQREQRRRRRKQETAEQREHRLAQRRQRRPQSFARFCDSRISSLLICYIIGGLEYYLEGRHIQVAVDQKRNYKIVKLDIYL